LARHVAGTFAEEEQNHRGNVARQSDATEGHPRRIVCEDSVDEIARRAGKTPAQVVLRWHVERGDIVFPKSVTPARISENIEIFDFELSGEDVEAISALNRNERTGPDPDKFDWIPG